MCHRTRPALRARAQVETPQRTQRRYQGGILTAILGGGYRVGVLVGVKKGREILDYRGEGLPGELTLGFDRSAEIAEDSLRVDDVTHGRIDDGVIHDSEGRKQIVQHVNYERSQKNRRLAIKIHGTTCAVCEFNFDEVYGSEYADGYIQIHHVKPLSQYEGKVDPATDMFPLCANCHAMAHKKKDTVASIDDLKALIEKAKG